MGHTIKHRYLQFIAFWSQSYFLHPSLFQQYHIYVLFSRCGVICPFRVATNCDVVTYILNANFRSQNVICRNVTSQLWCNLLSTYKTTCARLAFGPNSADPALPLRAATSGSQVEGNISRWKTTSKMTWCSRAHQFLMGYNLIDEMTKI